FFFSSRRRHTRWPRDWSSDVCSSDLQMIFHSLFFYTIFNLITHLQLNLKQNRSENKLWNIICTLEFEKIKWELLVFTGWWVVTRSEERRVGKECRYRWSVYY